MARRGYTCHSRMVHLAGCGHRISEGRGVQGERFEIGKILWCAVSGVERETLDGDHPSYRRRTPD